MGHVELQGTRKVQAQPQSPRLVLTSAAVQVLRDPDAVAALARAGQGDVDRPGLIRRVRKVHRRPVPARSDATVV